MDDRRTSFEEYVAWYSWAKSALGGDAVACHAAAAAATEAMAGGDREAAAAAGWEAAHSAAALERARAVYDRQHRYVDLFVWARSSQGLADADAHEAVRTALASLVADETQDRAAEAAAHLGPEQPSVNAKPPAPETVPDGAVAHSPRPEPEVSGWRLLLTIGLWPALSVLALAVTIVPIVVADRKWVSGHAPDVVAIVLAELYLALLGALLVAFGGPAGLRSRLRFRFTAVRHLLVGPPLWLPTIIVGLLLTAPLIPVLGKPQSNVTPVIRLSFDPFFVVTIVLTLCLLAPVCEELLVRGALYGWLRRRLTFWLAIPISAVVFAGAHALPPLLPELFVLGVATAAVREWTGSTLNSAIVHATQNVFAVVAGYYLLSQ